MQTIYVSKTLRHSAVAIVSEKPKTQDITALTANANAAQAEKVKAADKEIARINSEKESAVASVSKKGAKMAPWGTGGSYADRMKAYNAQVKSVEADYQAKKKNAGSAFEERLKKAEATKAAALTDPTLGASIAAANRVNEFEINNYMTKTESFSDFLLKISLYSTAILWFTGAMIGFAAAAGGIGLVPSLLGESNEQHSGAASMALASGASTGLLPSQYKKHTAELSAVHEAGHFVANAYMNAVGVNSKIEIEKISIESDGAVGSLGVVVAYFTYDQCHTNTCLRLAMLTAGIAAEYVALGNGVTPTQYLKAAEYEKLPSHSDLGQFNEIIKKESLNTTFERVYLETVKWLQGDNAMLQVVTSEILSKRCIEGDAVKALFRNCENWYRSKEGKELVTADPSVEDPKTAEKNCY